MFAGLELRCATSNTSRQTFVTQLVKKGRVLAELDGHNRISVTQSYIDMNDGFLARAVETL